MRVGRGYVSYYIHICYKHIVRRDHQRMNERNNKTRNSTACDYVYSGCRKTYVYYSFKIILLYVFFEGNYIMD